MNTQSHTDCSVHELKTRLDQGDDFFLLDVREPFELEIVKLDAAHAMPMNEIPEQLDALAQHRDKEIIVMCHLGGRSGQVQHYLLSQGFAHVRNLLGGIDAYAAEIDPSLERY